MAPRPRRYRSFAVPPTGCIEILDDSVTVDLHGVYDSTPLADAMVTITNDTSVCDVGSPFTDWRHQAGHVERYQASLVRHAG